MYKANQKGFTVIELLLTLMLIVIVSPLVFSIFYYGITSYNTFTKYMSQQDKITEAIQYLRRDIEEASGCIVTINETDNKIVLSFSDGRPEKSWWFKDGTLNVTVEGKDQMMVDGLDATSFGFIKPGDETPDKKTSASRFDYTSTHNRLLLIIKPRETNVAIYKNRNVNKPITTEFSVKYKTVS